MPKLLLTPTRWTFSQTEAAELAVNAAVFFRNRAKFADRDVRSALRGEMRYEAKKAVAAARYYMASRY